ncbi:hypothetical protein [Streptomyces sp. BH105]|uniref:hypothetical protein n=1 Tax=Streptomyces sp. BH105 TaxID=3410408 RepID=UPI003CE87D95
MTPIPVFRPYRRVVSHILTRAFEHQRAYAGGGLPLEELLRQTAAAASDHDLFGDDVAQSRTWAVKEAAQAVLVCVSPDRSARITDAGFLRHLVPLDALPHRERTTLLEDAARRTRYGSVTDLPLFPVGVVEGQHVSRRPTSCACVCAYGGFCGGCGHAGCGAR